MLNKVKEFRFENTHKFLSKYITNEEQILDLGTSNQLSDFLIDKGFKLQNAAGFDFDLNPEQVNQYDYDVLTAFEVLEHLVAPFGILQRTKASKLVVTVPLRLWFAPAYRNVNDPYDQHYHEFESWQLDMLLEKAGWTVKDSEHWTPPFQFNGVRSFLRAVTPRFYAVYAERKA